MYQPPDDIWKVNEKLRLEEALNPAEDPRWVDTGEARGQYSLRPLYRTLGVDGAESTFPPRLRTPPERGYHLFCGHRGCGKSTELLRIRNDLDAPDLYYVVFADVAQDLDPNNLRYQDVLLHLAAKLTGQLEEHTIAIDDAHIAKLKSWFNEHVVERAEIAELTSHVETGVQVAAGLPYIGKLLAKISTWLKTNSTHKELLRRILINYFSDFAAAFNHLIEEAENALRDAGRGRRILFIVDGTDRLSESDARAFFINDVHQLQQVNGLFVYCAPIHLSYETVAQWQSSACFGCR